MLGDVYYERMDQGVRDGGGLHKSNIPYISKKKLHTFLFTVGKGFKKSHSLALTELTCSQRFSPKGSELIQHNFYNLSKTCPVYTFSYFHNKLYCHFASSYTVDERKEKSVSA